MTFLLILGLFWANLDYLILNPGYLPTMHCRISSSGVQSGWSRGGQILWRDIWFELFDLNPCVFDLNIKLGKLIWLWFDLKEKLLELIWEIFDVVFKKTKAIWQKLDLIFILTLKFDWYLIWRKSKWFLIWSKFDLT